MAGSGQRTGIANLPLHHGKVPPWLFGRMCQLAREITVVTVYETPVSLRDPASYGFAHGGKDGYPYPVDRKTYDSSIQFLAQAVEKAKIGDKDKLEAFRGLQAWE
jgi:hypothetical protein